MRDLSLTTNGVLLDRLAQPLVDAGLRRVNVSLDSLDHVRFAEITRRDALDQVLRGLEEAERYPELRPIKVNCVAIKGFTEDEVPRLAELARRKPYVVRFIEFMPLDADEGWRDDQVLTGAEIRALIEAEHGPLVELPKASSTAPLRVRRRERRARVRQPRVRAVLLDLRPHPPHRRRTAPHVPLLAREWDLKTPMRDGPRRRAGRAPPERGRPQGAEAPDQRAGLRPRLPLDVPDRRLGEQTTRNVATPSATPPRQHRSDPVVERCELAPRERPLHGAVTREREDDEDDAEQRVARTERDERRPRALGQLRHQLPRGNTHRERRQPAPPPGRYVRSFARRVRRVASSTSAAIRAW